MPKINFGVDGVGKELQGYSGKPPKPGVYNGVLKRLEYTTTKGGKNPGTPMIKAMVVIDGPASAKEFHGAAVWRNLVIMDSTTGFVNQFLNALTDGSQAQIDKIQRSFWKLNETVVNDEGHITKIGTFKIGSPEGRRPVVIQVKHRKYEGEVQAEIANWIRKESSEEGDAEEIDDTELEADVEDLENDADDAADEGDPDDPWGSTDESDSDLVDDTEGTDHDGEEPPF